MPSMTRAHYNIVADATNDIINKAVGQLDKLGCTDPSAKEAFRVDAATAMARALAGTNSQFKFDTFRERCLGIKRGR